MKKIYLAVFLACSMGGAVHAQLSEGGLPRSMSLSKEIPSAATIATLHFETPDFATARMEDQKNIGAAKAYRSALLVNSDISLQNSGSFTYLPDGSKIWRLRVRIDEVQALNFYYDRFALPEGVKYFVYNANGRQILGAFTSANNSSDGLFATAQVQGGDVILEMNISAKTDISKIAFHINKIGAFYRGEEALTRWYGSMSEGTGLKPTDASPCHINAACPQGAAYPEPRKATVRITIPINPSEIGFCSGTLINNAAGNCKPYLLTASHCDGANGRTDDHFTQFMFDFNYEWANCDGTGAPSNVRTLNGANFRARSNYPSAGGGAVADFLLLELRNSPGNNWGTYMAGWNRSATVFNDPEMDFFIGFHHPAGDLKKLSTTDAIDPNGTFNQNVISATHWSLSFGVGYSEGGSSGSGLFDKNGRLIGDLSGGEIPAGACAPAGPQAKYSKLSKAWDFDFDPSPGPATRLKDWLDPGNTGATRTDAVAFPCTPTSGINETILGNSVNVYPNPATNYIRIKTNFVQTADLEISIYDITGKKMGAYQVENAASGEYKIETSTLPNGIYLVNFLDKKSGAKVSRKVVINR